MENVQVYLRVRPQSRSEAEANDTEIWHIPQPDMVTLHPQRFQELLKSKKITVSNKNEFFFSITFI